ncbi:MAG TPA: pseudouridine-5'-phosphate glycosidase [Pseudonocardiaceae bacterium]
MPHVTVPPVRLAPEVADALATGTPVVALESTLLAHGLPAGTRRGTADELEAVVRAGGAVPATIAVLDGVCAVGLSAAELDRLCAGPAVKLSRRDLGPAVAAGVLGATTVASTSAVAALAGISVFATGGLGGVHRGARDSWDESADLAVLAATPVLVVCSGVKSILDAAATLERLESLSVPVLGYRTDTLPAFYLRESELAVSWRVDSAAAAAAAFAAHRALGGGGAVLAHAVPAEAELDRALHDRVLAEGLELVRSRGIGGKDVTPVLLDHFHTATEGASLRANVALVLANAALAAAVAAELGGLSRSVPR